jgi:putative ABC transport system permease protein
MLTLAPAVNGLPVAGYLAIALVLLGAVLLMPWLAAACLERCPCPHCVPLGIAVAQLKATPRQSAISIAAIVTSVSLMVSMLIMVNSFRTRSRTGWSACCPPTSTCAPPAAARRPSWTPTNRRA